MRRGIIVLVASGAIAAAAEEPRAPAPPPGTPPPDVVQPEELAEVQTDQLEALRQQERDPSAPPQVVVLPILVNIPPPGRPCYFIRTLKPVMPEADMQRRGFIPLQARVNALQRGPDCSNAGELAPLIPAEKPDVGQPQADPALTPVALAPAPAAAPKPAAAAP